jgi:hypothetical protein
MTAACRGANATLISQRGEFKRQLFDRIPLGWRFHLVYARLEVNGHFLALTGR